MAARDIYTLQRYLKERAERKAPAILSDVEAQSLHNHIEDLRKEIGTCNQAPGFVGKAARAIALKTADPSITDDALPQFYSPSP